MEASGKCSTGKLSEGALLAPTSRESGAEAMK